MVQQLIDLHLRILSEPVDTDDQVILEELVLWEEVVRRTGDPEDGWVAVISLLLRDPSFVIY